jgi:hypothetical protein
MLAYPGGKATSNKYNFQYLMRVQHNWQKIAPLCEKKNQPVVVCDG